MRELVPVVLVLQGGATRLSAWRPPDLGDGFRGPAADEDVRGDVAREVLEPELAEVPLRLPHLELHARARDVEVVPRGLLVRFHRIGKRIDLLARPAVRFELQGPALL